MKVQCGQCPAQYAVADERVRDKKVRIRCKRCNAAIVVDGKVTPPLVTSTPAPRSARPPSGVPAPESAPPSSPEPDSLPSPRPVAHTIMGGLEAPVTRQLVAEHVAQRGWSPLPAPGPADAHADPEWFPLRPGMPEADRGFTEPPVRGDVERWRVALTQQDLRWMTTQEITEAFRDGAVKSETFVFRAGMPTWVTLLEVNEIAQALADAGYVSAPLQAPRAASFDEEAGSGSSDLPPPRISSLPPPRKVMRQRSSPDATESETGLGGDGASDSDESLPFALVAGRANGAKKSIDAPAADASAEPMAMLDASLRELAAREGSARDAARRESAAEATPLAPATSAAPANGAAATSAAAGEQPSSMPSPLEPVQTASAAQPKSGSGLWIGVLVVLLIAGAAVFYFRFSLGLP
jgi:predicted Zn finger-like uncharacterized protein